MSDGSKCEFVHIDFWSLSLVNSERADSEDTDALEERER